MKRTALIGLGNPLMGDEAIGLLVLEQIQQAPWLAADTELIEGGTSGLLLISELQDFERLIFVDAARFGAEPGAVRVFPQAELNLARPALPTSHDVGLTDLLGSMALLSGRVPAAWLVGIQVGTVGLGLSISAEVRGAIEPAVAAVKKLMES